MSDTNRQSLDNSPIIAGALQFLLELAADGRVDDETRHRATRLHSDLVEVSTAHRLRLAVVGEFSAGKSTFINALLGADLLASDIEPTTATATRLTWGPAFQVEVRLPDGATSTLWPATTVTRETISALAARMGRAHSGLLDVAGGLRSAMRVQAAEFIRAATTERAGASRLDEVVIRLPSPYLAAAIDLLDIPGFNPGLPPADKARHLAITRRCVESSHLALFVIDSRNPLKASERDHLEMFAPFLSRIFFVANKMDMLDSEEAEEAEDYIRSDLATKFGIAPEASTAYFVSSVAGSSREGESYRANLTRLREDVVAFMQREREALMLERAARILAAEAKALSEHARDVTVRYRRRLDELRALQVEDAGSMRRAVLEIASRAYASTASAMWASFGSAIEDHRGRAAQAFWAEISAVSERDKVRTTAEAIVDKHYAARFWEPLRDHLVECLAKCLGQALGSMHTDFSSRFATANVPQPRMPDRNAIRGLAERLVGNESARAGVSEAVAQGEAKGNIAKGVGGAGVLALGLVFGLGGAAFGLARVGAAAMGALFGASIDELKQRALKGFHGYLDGQAAAVSQVAQHCLLGEHPDVARFVTERIDEQIDVYTREVSRLQAAHEARKRSVEGSIAALEDASASAGAYSENAMWQHTELRTALTQRRDLGRPDLTPVLDEALVGGCGAEAFGAAMQGAVDGPVKLERWLVGNGARVRGSISETSRHQVRLARAGVDLSVALSSGVASAWLAEHGDDVRLLGLQPADLAALSPDREIAVVDTQTALVAAGRLNVDLTAIANALDAARGLASAELRLRNSGVLTTDLGVRPSLGLDAAFSSMLEVYRSWSQEAPDSLLLGYERLRAELDRRSRRALVRRRARQAGVVFGLATAAVLGGLGFIQFGSTSTSDPAQSLDTAAVAATVVPAAAPPASSPPTPIVRPPSDPAVPPSAPMPSSEADDEGAVAQDSPGAVVAIPAAAAPAIEPVVGSDQPSPTPALVPGSGIIGCSLAVPTRFQLRVAETVAANGVEYPRGTSVEILEVGSLGRAGDRNYRVRVPTEFAVGWIFLGASTVTRCLTGETVDTPSVEVVSIDRLVPDSVGASSFIVTTGHRYPPENAFDGDQATAWNESARGPGAGEWIQATYTRPHHIQRVRLSTGWTFQSQNHGDLFTGNSHLRRVRLAFGHGASVVRDVAIDEREISFDDLDVNSDTVRIVAEEVWPGTRWSDLCISEVLIEGQEQVSRPGRRGRTTHNPGHRAQPATDHAARAARQRPPAGGSPGSAVLDEARACIRRRDERGAIAVLVGRANSSEELAVLASLYRSTGQRPGAVRTMRQYISRYPHGPLVREFGDYVNGRAEP